MSNLTYLNNRHYDPSTGVFVSVDPLVTLTMEPYIFGAANSVTMSDPSGLEPRPIHDRNSDYRPSDWSGRTTVAQEIANIFDRPDGFLGSASDFAENISQTPVRAVGGTFDPLTNPVETFEGVRHAVTNPIATLKAIVESCTGSAAGAGECTGDIILAALTGKASKNWLGDGWAGATVAHASTGHPLRNIPGGARMRILTPSSGVSEGVEWTWTDPGGQTVRFRVHGPDSNAPMGSNAASGPTYRVRVGSSYLDADGNAYHRNVHNPLSPFFDASAANATHIPFPGIFGL